MEQIPDLSQLSEQQVRELAGQLLLEAQQDKHTIQRIQLQNEQYKHELAILKRHRFARSSEVLDSRQRSLLDDLVEEDLAGIEKYRKNKRNPPIITSREFTPRRPGIHAIFGTCHAQFMPFTSLLWE
jgi:hypothetical protein